MEMKTLTLMCLLSMIASADLVVSESVKNNPVTGVKVATVGLLIKGDGDSLNPATLGLLCQQMSFGARSKKYEEVILTLDTGVAVAENRSRFGG